MTTTTQPRDTTTRPSVPAAVSVAGVAGTLIAAAGTVYGAHSWTEIIVVLVVLTITAGVVFGRVVPNALRREGTGGTALALAVPAAVLLLPAFWSGLPLVLGLAGVMVGNHGRAARVGSGRSITALVLGALTVVGYLVIYLVDGVLAGNAGFLFD